MRCIRVSRNRYGKPEQAWLVTCSYCSGDGKDGLFGMFIALGGKGLKGYAADWRTAQDYATRHALAHEETRCQACLHVPAEVINDVRATR